VNAPNPHMTAPNGQGNGNGRPANQQTTSSKMTLAAITRGRVQAPLRVLCYGVEGVGKSTLGADSPAPIFLGAEDGTAHLDVARLPQPETWADVLAAVALLTREQHEFKTLVIDSLDWVEPLIHVFVCAEAKVKSMEDVGYGKLYIAALEQWRLLISALDRLRTAKRMHVVMVAHALVKGFKNPEGPDYERYQLKIHDKAAALLREWVDELLFARFETFSLKGKGEMRAKGVSTGARVVQTIRAAAYDAKTRHGLRDGMPLSWEEIERGCMAGAEEALSEAQRDAEEALAMVPDADRAKADAWVREVWGTRDRLAQRVNQLRAKYARSHGERDDSTTNHSTTNA
jgi:hypothetical protein